MTFDFEKTLREQAEKCQDENRARFLAGETLEGASVVPDKKGKTEEVGVRTGALLADLDRRENIQVDKSGFIIKPSPDQAVKWAVFNSGRTVHGVQPARPVSGISEERHQEIAEAIAREAREQLVRELRARLA